MLVSLRQPINVPTGLWGNMTLMALAARPPRRGNDNRPNLAIAAIRHYAAWGFYDQFGFDHPENPRIGNRGRADRRAGLEGVFADLKNATDAGRLFLSSLYARYPGVAKGGNATVKFRGEPAVQVDYPALSHSAQLDAFVANLSAVRPNQGVEPKSIRQARWDNWLATIHLGAAFALLHDSNVELQGHVEWRKFCRSLLFQQENDHVAQTLVTNANRLLDAAEECHLFQKAKPRPLAMSA